MIINKETLSFLTRSDKPNSNWTSSDNYYIVDDNSELGQKILNNYPNIEYVIENEEITDVTIIEKEKVYTHEEINAMVVNKIREKYSINDEFKMINLGIGNPQDEEYLEYREYVLECKTWGDNLEKGKL